MAKETEGRFFQVTRAFDTFNQGDILPVGEVDEYVQGRINVGLLRELTEEQVVQVASREGLPSSLLTRSARAGTQQGTDEASA